MAKEKAPVDLGHKVKKITPEWATAILNKSQMAGMKNRPLSQFLVHKYAEMMKKGEWLLNGESISLDKNGCLVNGQHRLHACIKANVPFYTVVCTNVQPGSFATYDTGKKRDAGQVLAISDVPYSTNVASIIRGIDAIRRSGVVDIHHSKLSNMEVLEEYNRHPEAYVEAAKVVATPCNTSHYMTPRLAGTLYFYLAEEMHQPKELVTEFVLGILSLDTVKNPHIDALRVWNSLNTHTKVSERTRYGYAILAWNAMINHDPLPRKPYNFFSEKKVEIIPELLSANED